MSFHDRLAGFINSAAYHMAVVFLALSRIPVIGKPFESLGGEARLKVVTVPVGLKLRGESAILPFGQVRRLVEAASYVAIADTCMCRQSRRCKSCERACPFKAIRVDPRTGPAIDGTRCKGCGRCEAACPAKALKVFPMGDEADIPESCERSVPNAYDMMERFLAMVR